MTPPQWLCKALYEVHPKLRLAWAGREKSKEDIEAGALNCGSFALIQLFAANIVGDLSDPNIFSELWEVTPRINESGAMEMTKIDRGPVFNHWGTTTLDYDPLLEHPVYIINLEGIGFNKYNIHAGAFLPHIARWRTSAKKRMKESIEAKYKEHKAELKDLSSEAGDFLWWQANRSSNRAPVVPWEFAKQDVKKFYEGNKDRKLESLYKLKDQL